MRAHLYSIVHESCNQLYRGNASVAKCCRLTIEYVEAVMDFERGAIVLADPDLNSLRLFAHSSLGYNKEDFCTQLEIIERTINSNSHGTIRRVSETGQPMIIDDVLGSDEYLIGDESIRSELCLPLQAHGKCYGAINFESRSVNNFDRYDLVFIDTLGTQLAFALANAQKNGELPKSADWRWVYSV